MSPWTNVTTVYSSARPQGILYCPFVLKSPSGEVKSIYQDRVAVLLVEIHFLYGYRENHIVFIDVFLEPKNEKSMVTVSTASQGFNLNKSFSVKSRFKTFHSILCRSYSVLSTFINCLKLKKIKTNAATLQS